MFEFQCRQLNLPLKLVTKDIVTSRNEELCACSVRRTQMD